VSSTPSNRLKDIAPFSEMLLAIWPRLQHWEAAASAKPRAPWTRPWSSAERTDQRVQRSAQRAEAHRTAAIQQRDGARAEIARVLSAAEADGFTQDVVENLAEVLAEQIFEGGPGPRRGETPPAPAGPDEKRPAANARLVGDKLATFRSIDATGASTGEAPTSAPPGSCPRAGLMTLVACSERVAPIVSVT
jgi:hypothetical protein